MLFLIFITILTLLIIGLLKEGNWENALLLILVWIFFISGRYDKYKYDKIKKESKIRAESLKKELEENRLIFINGFHDEHDRWQKEEEWKHRHPGEYPKDWDRRRYEVFWRERGLCESCGGPTGRIHEPTISNLIFKLVGPHLHHKIPLSRGGDNSLENLELLCAECHANKHPEKKKLIKSLSDFRPSRYKKFS